MFEPFAADPDLTLYVARPASERAVSSVLAAMQSPRGGLSLLYGPPGIGKSIVLARVADELARSGVVLRIDHEGLSYPDICAWFSRELDTLDLDSPPAQSWSERVRGMLSRNEPDPRDHEGSLVHQIEARARRGSRVFALIDEADEMDAPSLRSLEALAQRCGGNLSLCAATANDATCDELPPSIRITRFTDAMTEAETQSYVATRLARAQAPAELVQHLSPERVQRLHRFSGGNPRRLHAELSLIRIEAAAPQGPPPQRTAPRTAPPEPSAAGTPPTRPENPSITSTPEADSPPTALVEPDEPLQSTRKQPAEESSEAGTSPVPSPPAPRATPPVESSATPVQQPSADPPLASTSVEVPGRPIEPPTAGSSASASVEPSAAPELQPSPTTPSPSPGPTESPKRPSPTAAGTASPERPAKTPVASSLGSVVPIRRRQRRSPTQSPARSQPDFRKPMGYGALAAVVVGTIWWGFLSPEREASREAPEARPELSPPTPTPDARSVERDRSTSADAPISVNINADPWATIWVDGRLLGETPLGDVPLPAGSHRFEARLPDGSRIEQTLEISPARRWVYFE